MTKKVKLSDIGKDLNIPCQEIVDFLEEFSQEKKKNTSALKEDELNLIIEHFSQKNQVAGFEAYFKSKNTPIADTKEKSEQDNIIIRKSDVIKDENKDAVKVNKYSIAKEEHMDKNNNSTPNNSNPDNNSPKPANTSNTDSNTTKPANTSNTDSNTTKPANTSNTDSNTTKPANNTDEKRPYQQGNNQNGYNPQRSQNNNGYVRNNTSSPNNNGYVRNNTSSPNNNGYVRNNTSSPNNNGYVRNNTSDQNNNGYVRNNTSSPNNNGYVRNNNSNQNNNGYVRNNTSSPNNNGYVRNNTSSPNNNGYVRNNTSSPNNNGYVRNNTSSPNNNGYVRNNTSDQNNNGYSRNNNSNQNNNQRYNRNDGRPAYQNNNTQQTPAPKPAEIKQPAKPVGPTEKVVRTVNTRGSYVELDKYNERYEQMAGPQNTKHNKDNYAKKQKLNQRSVQRNRQQFSNKRETEAEKMRRLALERARKQQLKVMIPDAIVVSELATRLKVTATEVIKKLMGLGIMANINQEVDFDTAALVAEELGAKVEKEVIVTIEERLIDDRDDDDDNQEERSPVVVVMGHVDHGKTSLLDRIRHANVTASEAGGITQHIGAYRVKVQDKEITFLDTPGHEAFTSMRARGASITDIAILVVAADDGIMPQTIEAINHAKAAEVSIIVAINKMDKEGANPDKIKQSLTEYGLVPEEWGGDIVCVPVSAKTGEGMDDLLENVSLVSAMRELKANPNRLAKGAVIEARMDKGRGPIATILIQNGTLHQGDVIIAGTAVGKIRVMTDDKGREVETAGPSVPVEITGLAEVPSAGDTFNAVENERLAKTLVEKRRHEAKQEQFNAYQNITLDNLFSQIAEGEIKELPIIIKADVQGSVEAVKQSLEKLSNEEVRVKVIHGGVGAISESDVMLASASNAIIVAFNVRPDPVAAENANRDGVDIRLYRIIYDAIEEISTAMKGMLAPKFRENLMARIEVRQVYKITNVGLVSGCYILDGKVTRACQIRVVRDGIVIAEDKIDSLKRFKDDVKDVAQGYECGISLVKFSDIKEGDIFEAFIMEEYKED